MVGMAEEFIFRGYLQYTLTRGMGFWPAAVLASVLFGLVHLDVPGEPWTAVANIVLLSLSLSIALLRTGSLWFSIGSHMAFDWGLAFFYSCDRTSVHGYLFNATLHGSKWLTGGTAGPEGNIFNVFLVAAAILLLSQTLPTREISPCGYRPLAGAELRRSSFRAGLSILSLLWVRHHRSMGRFRGRPLPQLHSARISFLEFRCMSRFQRSRESANQPGSILGRRHPDAGRSVKEDCGMRSRESDLWSQI